MKIKEKKLKWKNERKMKEYMKKNILALDRLRQEIMNRMAGVAASHHQEDSECRQANEKSS